MSYGKWLDKEGYRDDHFGSREREALNAQNNRGKKEARERIEKNARQAKSKAALKGKGKR